jgi:6-phosphofructokinase
MLTRVGYISARIIQLGYIQRGVMVQQEYDRQRGVRMSDNYNNTELKAMMGSQTNYLSIQSKKRPWEITG